MSKKRKKARPVQAVKPKSDVVWRQSAEEATLASKPRYNGFACGHGAHGPAKYSRARAKQAWKRQMRQEGASRGSFLFCCGTVDWGRRCSWQIEAERARCFKGVDISLSTLSPIVSVGRGRSLGRCKGPTNRALAVVRARGRVAPGCVYAENSPAR